MGSGSRSPMNGNPLRGQQTQQQKQSQNNNNEKNYKLTGAEILDKFCLSFSERSTINGCLIDKF